MSDKTLTERLGCLFDLPDWVELLRRLDVLWQAHKQAQLERGMEKTVFSANTELAQVLADLHVENATLAADNAVLHKENEILLAHNCGLKLRIGGHVTNTRANVATIRGMHATIDMHVADLASLRAKNEALEEELWEERGYCPDKEALKMMVGKERMTVESLRTKNEALEETLEERVADLKMMTGLCRKCLAKNVALEARTRMPDGWLETLGGDPDYMCMMCPNTCQSSCVIVRRTGMDKYDDMPLEELAAKTLAMMGYTQYYPSLWMNNGVVHKEWQTGNILFSPESHAFAAEVKGWMVNENWRCTDTTGKSGSSVAFYRLGSWRVLDDTEYADMAAQPRAVCLAALRAKAAEKEVGDD